MMITWLRAQKETPMTKNQKKLARLADEAIALGNAAQPGARWTLADLEVTLRFLRVSGPRRLYWIASLGGARAGGSAAPGATAIEALTALRDQFGAAEGRSIRSTALIELGGKDLRG
jgi:hypothetical protein